MGDYRTRTHVLLNPALQLKLPLVVLVVTLVYVAFQVGHSYYAFNDLFSDVFTEAGKPAFLEDLIQQQTATFIEVAAEVTIAYLLLVAGLSITYVHRMVGPMVAFRRHIEALKNGDFRSRVRLRKGDAFLYLVKDLNELAEILEIEERRKPSNPA
jgi:hypothetical protein